MVRKLKLIQQYYENTIIINKSRFIAEAFRVNTLDEIEDILTKTRKKYYDANHHCYAYRLDENRQKCSDDGEPAKTAGAPILDVLNKMDITNILVIVTRYFGGILLGTGGLVRAYSSATSEVLKNAKFFILEKQIRFKATLSYSAYQIFTKMFNYVHIEKTSFLDEVIIEGYCKEPLYQNLQKDAYTYKIGDILLENLGLFPIEVPADI